MSTTPTLLATQVPLADTSDAVLLDLDGVVWRGADVIENARESLATLAERNIPAVYVTNNASRTPEDIAGQLVGMGIPADAEHIMTSSLAARSLLRRSVEPGARVLCVGGPGLRDAVTEAGYEVVRTADADPAAVMQGFGSDVGWPQLTEAAYAVGAGVPYFATNLDATLPTERGFAVGNGSLVAAVVNATGVSPTSSGKPHPGIFHEAAALVGATRPLMVGDRLDTDLAGARNADIPGVLVLTGVAQLPELLLASPADRPSYLVLDLGGLLEPHPSVTREGSRWVCQQAAVDRSTVLRGGRTYDLAELDVVTLDEARALTVASWHSSDTGGEPISLDRSVRVVPELS